MFPFAFEWLNDPVHFVFMGSLYTVLILLIIILMDLARMLGIMIVFGAPAIIGGGLVYDLLDSWLAVWLYEALLILVAVTTAIKAAGKPAPTEH
jgi:hypothetical protein